VRGLRDRIVVTGVAGLIGSHLAKALLERGWIVVGVDDLSLGHCLNIEPFLRHPSFTFVEESILNRERMEKICSGSGTIFHLAALKIPRYEGHLKTLEANAKGTEIILECASQSKARVIFASTDDVYGKNPAMPFSEESSLMLGESRVNRWSLAASKIYGEHLCFGYAEKYQIPISIIRYSGIYGPTFQLSKLSGVQDLFIYFTLTEQPIPIHGDGTQARPFTYVSDGLDATLRVLDAPHANNEVINVGSTNTISIINLAYLIWRVAGVKRKPELRFVPYSDFSRRYEDPRHRQIDISKANYLLGYRPKVSLEEGMQNQVKWFRDNLEVITKLNREFEPESGGLEA
jgi:UDP-glucose 4-epimerase